MATNGFVYFTSLLGEDIQIHQHIDSHVRESICRLRQVTKVLAKHRVQLYDLSLLYGKEMGSIHEKNILYLGYESTLHLTIGEIAMEANEEEWLIEMKLKIDRTQQS